MSVLDSRRGFLKGMFTATAAGLLVPANAGEIKAFHLKPDEPVVVTQPDAPKAYHHRGYLYDQFGTPVIQIKMLNMSLRVGHLQEIDIQGFPLPTFDAHRLMF